MLATFRPTAAPSPTRAPSGPMPLLSPEELLDTYWDPFVSRPNLGQLLWRDPTFFESQAALSQGQTAGRVIVTTQEDVYLRRVTVARVSRRDHALHLAFDRLEAPSGAPQLFPGQAIRCSWFHEGRWLAVCGHVESSTRTGGVLDLPDTGRAFPAVSGLFDTVLGAGRLFQGFDATLGDTAHLTAVHHTMRVQEVLNTARDTRRPALVYLPAVGVFVAARFAPPALDASAPRFGQRPPIELELLSTDLREGGWRPGLSVTVSSLVLGQTVAFRSRVVGGARKTLLIDRPEMFFRWDRRRAPRFAVGTRADSVRLLLPVRTGAPGAPIGHVPVQGLLDISVKGLSFVVDAAAASRLSLDTHPAALDLDGRFQVPLCLRVVNEARLDCDAVAVSATLTAPDPVAERALARLCDRLGDRTRVLMA